MNDDLIRQDAVTIVARLKSGEVTPHDLLDALEKRIAAVDGAVNALPTRCFERARQHADRLMQKPVAERGQLAGMPIPIKDLVDVAGVRSTQGSPIYANHLPEKSDVLVEHLEAEGGIVYAMSNTPEFGAGANTFNEVFGKTRNPWNTSRSAAGSSGGAAVALATGMAWLAHGSDMGGSLAQPRKLQRHRGFPAEHRTRRAHAEGRDRDEPRPAGADGAQRRGLCAAARRDGRRGPARSFLAAADRRIRIWRPRAPAGGRSASPGRPISASPWSTTRSRPSPARRRSDFAELGATVEEAHPDLTGLHECFITLRAYDFFMRKAMLLREHRELLKPEVIWNIEKGQKIDFDELERAENMRVVAGAAVSGVLRQVRSAAHARDGRCAVPDREPLCGRGERAQVRELRRVAGDRLRDHGVMRHRAVAALAASRARTCRSACRSRARRAARRASWPPRRRWRISSGCAARRRSIRA